MTSLKILEKFIDEKYSDFVGAIRTEAKKITLKEIIAETEKQEDLPRDIASKKNHEFKYGESIYFRLGNSFFKVFVDPEVLRLSYWDAPSLKEFRGSHTKSFYNKLTDQLQKEIERYLDELPF
ncbi:MAG: hypothetical protein PHT54_00290 [Candidatus Nanoarchaeia archaeon]|nr:hypothetical protein [Candidatus Nanoarchaeia archaeon]